jgi:hypothetical protein
MENEELTEINPLASIKDLAELAGFKVEKHGTNWVKINIEQGDWEKLKRLIRSRMYTAKADTKSSNNINVYFQQDNVLNCIEFTQSGSRKSRIPIHPMRD